MVLGKRPYKVLSAIIVAAILLPLLIIGSVGTNSFGQASADKKTDTAENTVVNDISNITGVRREEIVRLKNSGKSWVEILEILKSVKGSNNQKDISSRDNMLAESGIDESLTEELKNYGFDNNKIAEAKTLLERLMIQLSEITASINDMPENDTGNGKKPGIETV